MSGSETVDLFLFHFFSLIQVIVKCGSHLKAKAYGVSLEICKVWKLYAMSLVMWTCWNDLGLNLCVMPPMSHVVAILENSLVRSYKKSVTNSSS